MGDINVINQVLVLVLIMLIGAYCSKKNIISDKVSKGLSDLLINITFPFLIINSFSFQVSKEIASNLIKLFIYSVLIYILIILVSKIIFIKFSDGKREVARFAAIFSNCGFMGFPILYAVYGDLGILYGSIFNAAFNLFIWTYGVMLLSKEKGIGNLKKLFLNSGILSVCIGLIIMIFSINLPYPVRETIRVVGSMTTPLSMIILGYMLTELDMKTIFNDIAVYYLCLIKLIAVPLMSLAVLNLFKMDPVVRNVIVISQAMPVASLCAIFARSYDKEREFASKLVFITTVLSVLTIPFFTMIFL